jgi:hypothetical protein
MLDTPVLMMLNVLTALVGLGLIIYIAMAH